MVEDQLFEEYVNTNFGEMTYKIVYFANQANFDMNMNLFKESVINNDSMTDEQKQEMQSNIQDYNYEHKEYLVFHIRLKEPTMVKQTDYTLTSNDENGEKVIYRVPV